MIFLLFSGDAWNKKKPEIIKEFLGGLLDNHEQGKINFIESYYDQQFFSQIGK